MIAQFNAEIAYFQDNTDGLIVDEMRNPGGDLCFGENSVARLIPTTFRPIGHEIRPTLDYVNLFAFRVQSAQAARAPQAAIDQYQGASDHSAKTLTRPTAAEPRKTLKAT